MGHHSDNPANSQVSETSLATKKPGDKYVTRLYKSLEATAVHEAARQEMLQGFRPPFTQAEVCIMCTLCLIH
jgi:hypothetical protein